MNDSSGDAFPLQGVEHAARGMQPLRSLTNVEQDDIHRQLQ